MRCDVLSGPGGQEKFCACNARDKIKRRFEGTIKKMRRDKSRFVELLYSGAIERTTEEYGGITSALANVAGALCSLHDRHHLPRELQLSVTLTNPLRYKRQRNSVTGTRRD